MSVSIIQDSLEYDSDNKIQTDIIVRLCHELKQVLLTRTDPLQSRVPAEALSIESFHLKNSGDMATGAWSLVKNWFWSESFWLPPTSTWKDLEALPPPSWDETTNTTVTGVYPNANDLYIPFPLAIALFVVRLIWER